MTEMKLKEVIKIIKAAKKLGVISFKLGTLEFELSKDDLRVSRPTLKVSAKKIAEQTDRNEMQAQFSDFKDDLATMHVSDPAGFENAIVDRALDDDSGETIEETYN